MTPTFLTTRDRVKDFAASASSANAAMSLLPSTHSSLLSLFRTPTRCPRVLCRHKSSRAVVIKNFPSTFTMDRLLTLKGAGRPTELVLRHPENNEVEIRYLHESGAEAVIASASRGELVMDGQKLTADFVRTRALGVQVVAAIGLLKASRTLVFKELPEQFASKENLLAEMSRFGEVQGVWVGDGRKVNVTFSDIMTAVEKTAYPTGLDKLSPRFSLDPFSIHPERVRAGESRESRTVILNGRPVPRITRVLQYLTTLPFWQSVEPLLSLTTFHGSMFLQFSDRERAELFYKSYNPLGVRKKWAPVGKDYLSGPLVAARMGATRTLLLTYFTHPAITLERVEQDFSQFGELGAAFLNITKCVTHHSAKGTARYGPRQALIEYTHIESACRAIDWIYHNNCSFGIYGGSEITFGFTPDVGKQPSSPLLPIRLWAANG
ncbi:hypothetical protein D9758_002846 [Tetrapyrgos nigripes]|uniref:RRM domain-containing protein n=1 Tax=Tetrapyrgos nigripes TaxID=182062 RepID=A0A8H5LTR1_9AGAR|nr:hypothetical protein D9758_002846 [Tetrapyrgos nigripes]